MKLKKLISLDFVREFESLLETDFERKLLVNSLRNYASHGNPLRFHNFAFSMRELVLHLIERRASSKKVLDACWYARESPDREVTRRQQLKYCAQANLADEYLGDDTVDAINANIAEFLSEFRFFNKFTHITEKHLEPCPKRFFEDAKYIVSLSSECLGRISDLEQLVIGRIEELVHKSVVTTALEAVPEELSLLANHVFVDFTEVEEIVCDAIDHEIIHVTAHGFVHVSQEYGSKHDGCTINESYPFELALTAPVTNPEDLTPSADELTIDTSSWYE
ncbi:hypothetical protein F0M18_16445 [Pseudohalioglobus sediminis]|uniref:Uncharacterized protein n=1 Tax=Pseudohalioglobus sediminis TaxID=2606449 RepID=A0A5B0WQE3_9GAMM|nr:hypothetical protein [Pseudohalioglobus sediminis]KAA1189260.1 hypothetical protein F0M18_16445 [Pseudohalioglobus sediminis]